MDSQIKSPWESTLAESTPPAAKTKSIMEIIAQFASLASLLRLSGALTVMAAMSAFLLQGWAGGNDINRYYLLLSQTVLLAGGGFGLSFLLKENKGARVFFGLSLLSITANMATLGALIFSITPWDSSLGHYPAFATWQATSASAVMVALGIGIAVLTPVALFSFMVLARHSAAMLAALFLFTNLLLLIPVRESGLAGLIAMLGVLVPLWGVGTKLKSDITLRTGEGYAAVATLFVPALIVVIRSLCFYQMDALQQLLLAATGFVFLRALPASLHEHSPIRLASFALAVLIAHSLADILAPTSGQLFYTLFGITFAALGLDITLRSTRHQGASAVITAWGLGLSHAIPFIGQLGMLSALLFSAAGIAVFCIGRTFQQRSLLLPGTAMVISGVIYQLYRIATLVDFSSWATLAITGAGAIIAASILERHGAVLKLKWEQLVTLAIKENR